MYDVKIPADAKQKFQERVNRVNTAVALGTPDRVPIFTSAFGSWIQRRAGSSYKDFFYDYDKAGDASLKFYEEYQQCDITAFFAFFGGKANEIAGTQVIDWPGRPGTRISDYSSHQVIEMEMLKQDEYPELLHDYTGFMLRKFIPRAYANMQEFAGLELPPNGTLTTDFMAPLYQPQMFSAYKKLEEISKLSQKSGEAMMRYNTKLMEMGFPPMATGMGAAPYDILGDVFRGTMGIFEDLVDDDMRKYMEEAIDLFTDMQIKSLAYMKDAALPVKRVFFPLHKGMDGFMNDEQFENLYWKPLKKIMMYLIDMDVTPYIYTEGSYNTRLDFLQDVPKGKVIYHFEKVDMKLAKEKLSGIACINGNLPSPLLEFGTKEQVVTATRQLLEDCMPGGGYMFDFDGSLENAKQENVDAMFETLDQYGRY